MRKRERGTKKGTHSSSSRRGRGEARRGGTRESAHHKKREREREERGIDSTRHHDTTRWRRGHRQTGLTEAHVRDLADVPRGQVLVEGGGTFKH